MLNVVNREYQCKTVFDVRMGSEGFVRFILTKILYFAEFQRYFVISVLWVQADRMLGMEPEIRFCSSCGAPVTWRIPAGDNVVRAVCDACDTIHYQNPKLVVGTLPVWEDRVLLCKRAIEPRRGYWTLPAGFMENGESLPEAAARETREEACANIEIDDIYTLISVPHISQVHAIFRARLLDTNFAPGVETLDVALMTEAQIPWDDIAFRTVAMTLRHFFSNRNAGAFHLLRAELLPP